MENYRIIDRLIIIVVLLVFGLAVFIISNLSTNTFREYNDQFETIITHYKEKGKSQAEIDIILKEEFPKISQDREENLTLFFGGIFGIIGSCIQVIFSIITIIALVYTNWEINCLVGSIFGILYFTFSFSIILSFVFVWLSQLKEPRIIKTFKPIGWIYLTEKNESTFDPQWGIKITCLFWFIVVDLFYILFVFVYIITIVYLNKRRLRRVETAHSSEPPSENPSTIEEKSKSKERSKSKSKSIENPTPKSKSKSKENEILISKSPTPLKVLSNISMDDDDEESLYQK